MSLEIPRHTAPGTVFLRRGTGTSTQSPPKIILCLSMTMPTGGCFHTIHQCHARHNSCLSEFVCRLEEEGQGKGYKMISIMGATMWDILT